MFSSSTGSIDGPNGLRLQLRPSEPLLAAGRETRFSLRRTAGLDLLSLEMRTPWPRPRASQGIVHHNNNNNNSGLLATLESPFTDSVRNNNTLASSRHLAG